MNFINENIIEIAHEIVTLNGFFLIDVTFRGTDNNKIIEVFIDGEKNITAEDCAEISRKINSVIDEKQLIKSRYRLDISSPGVDRPLQFLKQYHKHIGRLFEVVFKVDKEKKNLKGKLLKIEGENLTFFTGKESVINFNDIIKAKVLISFS
jgi:ribosome maturation factor RimP